MAQNRIQFQPGMSMPEFIAQYGTEEQCAAALAQTRWPDGFRCPRCGSAAHGVIQDDRAKRFQCKACRHQTTLTAGTVMEATKLPLTTWFLAIHLLSQAKTGLSALALKRQLGVSYPTAWRMHHKLMSAMADREERYRLHGAVQIDDAYLGGERSGGKAGRGSENKVPFVAAVSLTEDEHPLRVKLTPVPGFTFRACGTGRANTWRPAARCIPTAWRASTRSPWRTARTSPPWSAPASRGICRSSSGSTPCSAI